MTTRDHIDRLRSSTVAFRDAVRREEIAREASRVARRARVEAARELADELRDAEIPERRGFEAAGIVVWWEGFPGGDRLGHIFLAFYREHR
jgi:hypothetical protein